jgi:RNA polymerase sigma factor (sigma-70 family)
MHERGDRDLVLAAQRGDSVALGELFARYWRAVRAAAYGATGEIASAEDAAGDAFAEAIAQIQLLRDPDRFGSWIRTIAIRKAKNGRRRRDLAMQVDAADALVDRSGAPDDSLMRLQLVSLVRCATRELPPSLREALELVYFEGYDSDAAARFLDIRGATLRRRLHDARERLRKICHQILEGRKQMSEDRRGDVQILKRMIESGEVFEAMRRGLALRPPPPELAGMLLRARGRQAGETLPQTARDLLRPSARALDVSHPVGSISAEIRKALPEFRDWGRDAGEVAAQYFDREKGDRERVRAVLPPGFAEGIPDAFVRRSRALIRMTADGAAASVYEQIRMASRPEPSDLRLSDVLDLMWMVQGSLELRDVQTLLARIAAVLPQLQIRFSAYDEPRYRVALQAHVGEVAARSAVGGVLAEWPGMPAEVNAAHIRIFLEPWAAARSGEAVEFLAFTS